jgi:hypothetical protein
MNGIQDIHNHMAKQQPQNRDTRHPQSYGKTATTKPRLFQQLKMPCHRPQVIMPTWKTRAPILWQNSCTIHGPTRFKVTKQSSTNAGKKINQVAKVRKYLVE